MKLNNNEYKNIRLFKNWFLHKLLIITFNRFKTEGV